MSRINPGSPHSAHAWPHTAQDWEALVDCRECGLVLLRQFLNISDWVVRRVEGINFVDDRTVRRRVSVDYTVPRDGVVMKITETQEARILPLTLMSRKSM